MRVNGAFAAALVAAAAALAGCGADPYPGIPDDGTARVCFVSEMNGFDPCRASEEIRTFCTTNTYEALYEYEFLRRPFVLKPCLAAALPTVSDDGLTWTILLKRKVKYVDDACFPGGKGREVVASDVVFSWQRLMDARSPSEGSWIFEGHIVGLDEFTQASRSLKEGEPYPAVEGLSAPDPYTIVIRLTKPYPQLSWVLAMGFTSVYPSEAVKHYGAEFLNHAVCTGPYRVADYRPAQRLVLERNPDYREEFYPSDPGEATPPPEGFEELKGRRLPLNERVVATVIKEDQPRWLYFDAGFADRGSIPKDSYNVVIDDRTKQLQPRYADRHVRLWKEPSMEIIYDTFNMRSPLVGVGEKARAIRRAVSLATNCEWAIRNIYNERAEEMQGVIPRGCVEYDESYRNPWKPQPGESRERVLERAREELRKGGFARPEDVPELEVDVPDSTTDKDYYMAWKRDCAEAGIRLREFGTTWQGQNERVQNGQSQVFGQSWMADYPDAQNFLQLFYSANIPSPNGSAYKNPQFDALYEKSSVLPPGPERTKAFHELQRMVIDEDCVWVVRYRRVNWYLTQPWFSGWRPLDISDRWFKYMHVDSTKRRAALKELNVARPLIPVVAIVVFLGLAVVTAVRGSRRSRGW